MATRASSAAGGGSLVVVGWWSRHRAGAEGGGVLLSAGRLVRNPVADSVLSREVSCVAFRRVVVLSHGEERKNKRRSEAAGVFMVPGLGCDVGNVRRRSEKNRGQNRPGTGALI